MTGAGGAGDSHGVPWSGRTLTPQPFAGDDGAADPALVAALADHAAARADEAAVLSALARARLLVPVLATVGEQHPLPDHVRGDAGAEMALPLLGGPDGVRALPVFTSVAALAAWDGAARPVPVEAGRAALSAVDEGCQALVLDPGGDGAAAFVVRRPQLWALAQGRAWQPPHRDPQLAGALAAALAPVLDGHPLRRLSYEPGRRAELAVVVHLEDGLDRDGLNDVLRWAAAALATVDLLTERAASVELRPRAAGPIRG